MFTGIIETIGTISGLEREGGNLHLDVRASIAGELKVDQSVAHNGVCLTVVAVEGDTYRVTAIDETLRKTNIGNLKVGDPVNLERALSGGMRLDGHLVQGHVDQTAVCRTVEDRNGSWEFAFGFETEPEFLVVSKGSVCVDGVSLTVVRAQRDGFTVAIIPYTFEHTIFNTYRPGSTVNIEFDVIGKYVHTYLQAYRQQMAG